MIAADYINKTVLSDTFRLTTSVSTFTFFENTSVINLLALKNSFISATVRFGFYKIKSKSQVIAGFSLNHSMKTFFKLSAIAVRFSRSFISFNFNTGDKSQQISSPSISHNRLGLNVF